MQIRRVVWIIGFCLTIFMLASCTPEIHAPVPLPDAGPVYGIYWFGKNDANLLAIPGEPNPHYDPSKATILFVHGWKPDQAYTHRTMLWEFEDAESGEMVALDLAASWIDVGWNVGIFDWGPFADEEFVFDAEAKIWTTEGGKGMRWRDEDGNYRTEHAPGISAGELFYESYVQAMADFSGPELRLAGHSLGNQMAVSLVQQLAAGIEADALPLQLLPHRLALLDPYWSPFDQDYLGGEKTSDRVRAIIEQTVLAQDIPVEWYRSSSLTDGFLISDANETLQTHVVFTEMRPRYCSQAEQVCKHEAAWQSYFLSFGSPPPPECERADAEAVCIATGRSAASASTSHERLDEMMSAPFHWIQVSDPDDIDNTLTRRTDDDWFERQPKRFLQ